jgi:hypothetical protein
LLARVYTDNAVGAREFRSGSACRIVGSLPGGCI